VTEIEQKVKNETGMDREAMDVGNDAIQAAAEVISAG
jgi:hypothetical protein